jgi:hypothetical protein
MKTIKWLLGLERGQLVIAMLMIAISSLFVQNQVKERQKDELNATLRNELLRRDDSCSSQKMKLIQDANRRVEEFMRVLLDRSRRTERIVDSTVHYNKKVINTTKKFLHHDRLY